jgi:hypothetical protein
MCSDNSSNYTHVLYHSEVRWLSQGNVLQQVVALHNEVKTFCLIKVAPGSKILKFQMDITISQPFRYIS